MEGFSTFGSTHGKSRLIESDLVKASRDNAVQVTGSNVWGASEENIGKYMYKIEIFICGSRCKRAIIYIDDLKIYGRVPSVTDYQRESWMRGARALVCSKRFMKMFSN